MRTVAAFNPVEHAIVALRGDVLGTATLADSGSAVAAAAGLWAVVALFRLARRRRSVAA
jgi:ABC-2 type transport system permease protein